MEDLNKIDPSQFDIDHKEHIDRLAMPYLIDTYGEDMALDLYEMIVNKEYDQEPLRSILKKEMEKWGV